MRELRLENTSRASRRRNFSPIMFKVPSKPEVGGGPIRDGRAGWQSSRGNPANRCSRIRTTPYGRSLVVGPAQDRTTGRRGVPDDLRNEMEKNWQVKLTELISYMQGFAAARGPELTQGEVRRKLREMCEEE